MRHRPSARLSVFVRWHWHATGGTGYHRINSIGVGPPLPYQVQAVHTIHDGVVLPIGRQPRERKDETSKGLILPLVATQACAHAPPSWFKAAMAKTASPPHHGERKEGGRVASLTSEHETGPHTTSVFRSPPSLPVQLLGVGFYYSRNQLYLCKLTASCY